MTHKELKYKVQQSGLKPAQIAQKIGVHPVHLRSVLRGALPLTDKLAGMVESCISQTESESYAVGVNFLVSLPAGEVNMSTQASKKLTDTERQQVMLAIRDKIDEEIARLSTAQD